jgi:hypothetical protein
VGTLFFTDVLGMTTQFIKSHGPASGGAWTYFIRPAYDSQLMHFHVRYSHYGTAVKENMNAIGFIRHDDRKEFDTNLRRTFWINRYGIDSFQASVNYNRYWSQENVLRSDELRTSLEFKLFKKWSLELDYDTDFKAEYAPYFEKDFRNRELGIDFGYDSKKGFAASIEVVTGVNYDQDFEEIEGSVELSPVKNWNLEYHFARYWFSPGAPDEQEWIHYIRTSYYFHKDMYVKLFYQTRNLYTDPWDLSTFEQVRKTFQIAYVWRFLPPFGSIQLAYQEGTTRHTEEEGAGRTFFTKLSWMF